MVKGFLPACFYLHKPFGVDSIVLGDNSKAYGDNSKGYDLTPQAWEIEIIRSKRLSHKDVRA